MNKTLIALLTAASVFTFGAAQAADAMAPASDKPAAEAKDTKAKPAKKAKHHGKKKAKAAEEKKADAPAADAKK